MNKEQLMIENEILKLEIMKRDNIIRHKNREIDALRARKTVYKHEMNCLRKKITRIYKILNKLIIAINYDCHSYTERIFLLKEAYDLFKSAKKV